MELGGIVKNYRVQNNMSMETFAAKCCISKGYISMIENNINPRNNKPIAPTLPTLKKIANGMGIASNNLLRMLNEEVQPTNINDTNFTRGELIKNRRKALGLSAEELGNLIGKTRATIYRYENGAIEDMPITILEPLAEALKTTPAYLMGWDENTIKSLSPEAQCLINTFDFLNDSGRTRLLEYAKELSLIESYKQLDGK